MLRLATKPTINRDRSQFAISEAEDFARRSDDIATQSLETKLDVALRKRAAV
jgi:hypothetical protein